MGRGDTSIGGANQGFPTTVWENVRVAIDPNHPECRAKMGELLAVYWKPVYTYIRRDWNHGVEEAKDLTQAFFATVLERGQLAGVSEAKGSFRNYLKGALKHFLLNDKKAAAVRRGGKPMFTLNASASELERLGIAASTESPEDMYDREWFRVLFESAVQELRRALTEEGKGAYVRVFESYCQVGGIGAARSDPSETPTYRNLARDLGIKVTDVRNYLTACRRRLREILRVRIAEYVAGEEEVEEELLEAYSH